MESVLFVFFLKKKENKLIIRIKYVKKLCLVKSQYKQLFSKFISKVNMLDTNPYGRAGLLFLNMYDLWKDFVCKLDNCLSSC